MSVLGESSKRQKLLEVADDAQESKVESLRCTVSQLEAELKEARSKLEFHLDVPVSTGTPTEVCWDVGLPFALRQKIASGREDLKAMQQVSTSWNVAFRNSVSKVRMGVSKYMLHPLPCISQFPNLVSVQLLGDLCGASLHILQGSRVRVLNLSGCKGVTVGIFASLKGTRLTDLDLSHCGVNDDCVLALCKLDLPLEKLNLSHTNVGDSGIEALLELPLIRTLFLETFNPEVISSAAFRSIKELPLASLKLSAGFVLRDWDDDSFDFDCVSMLKGMRLSELSLGCQYVEFTEAGLAGLVGMPLQSLVITVCGADFLSASLESLRGMPLQSLYLDMSNNCSISPSGWGVIQGMPLKSFTVHGDMFFNDATLEFCREMPLESLHLQGGTIDWQSDDEDGHITDVGFSYLKGLPLSSLNVHARISDEGLASLEGLPLTSLNVKGCDLISNSGFLVGLRGKSLVELDLSHVSDVTDVGFQVLHGMPLARLALRDCSMITDASLGIFRCLPLSSLSLYGCSRITDLGLSALGGSLMDSLTLTDCNSLTLAGLRSLEDLPKLRWLTIAFGEPSDRKARGSKGQWATCWDMRNLREAISGEMRGVYGDW